MKPLLRITTFWLLAVLIALPLRISAQDASQPAPFKKEEIEQLVAPIALYPDPLVAQILMASTYPLEIVSAARWVKANPNVKDKALEEAMQKQTWEASVKSLTAFPQVLAMMNDKLDMTQKLGDAFLGQQKEVLDAVQRLRAKAQAAGNLKSGKEQTVSTAQEGGTTVIKIESASPQVVYVPTYNPTLVYGPWPYPTYPPYYYYPPGYAAGAAVFSFAVGVAVGNAMWGNCNWGGGNVNINVNNYNSFNRTSVSNTNWNHSAANRKGVQYRDAGSQQKFGKGQQGAASREQFRGRAETGRQDIARGGAEQFKGADGLKGGAGGSRDKGGAAAVGDRGSGGAQQRTSARQPDAFQGAGRGAETRAQSSRGATSRSSAAGSARPAGGGGARGGGGRR